MILDLRTFSFETLLQDSISYPPGVSEAYLNREINNLVVRINHNK